MLFSYEFSPPQVRPQQSGHKSKIAELDAKATPTNPLPHTGPGSVTSTAGTTPSSAPSSANTPHVTTPANLFDGKEDTSSIFGDTHQPSPFILAPPPTVWRPAPNRIRKIDFYHSCVFYV